MSLAMRRPSTGPIILLALVIAPIVAFLVLRFRAIPALRFPDVVVSTAGWHQGTKTPDRAGSRGALRARLDHVVNPLEGFHRVITFDHVSTTPSLPGERFLVFYDLAAGDAALAYRCAGDGRVIAKGALDVSP
jgi:hypothetical protein